MADLPTKKISELPIADSVGDNDVFVGVQAGVTKRFPAAALSTFVNPPKPVYDLEYFGAKGSGFDCSEAFNQAIQLNNLSPNGIILRLNDRYRVTQDLPPASKPLSLEGSRVSGCSIFHDNCNSLVIDLSAEPAGAGCSEIRNIALTTNRNDKVGLVLIGKTQDAPGLKFLIDNLLLCPNSRFMGAGPDNTEWSVALTIGSPTVKTAEVNVTDLAIFGSELNDAYATRTQSIGIRAYSPTGLRIDRPKMVRMGTAISIKGQAEGALITGGTIFGVDVGIIFDELVNPPNNHVISNTHVSAYTKGIVFKTPAIVGDLSFANFISKCFILERESGTTKDSEYVGIEYFGRFSTLSDNVIWSNSTGGAHDRIGVRMSRNGNRCIGLTSNGNKYPFDIVSIDGASEGGSSYADDITVINAYTLFDKSANQNFVYTNVVLPTVGANGLNYRAASLRFQKMSGLNLFQFNSSGLTIGDTDSVNTAISMKSAAGTGGFDIRLVSIGGSSGSTSGQGDAQLTALSVRLNCSSVRPEVNLGSALGDPSFQWSILYAKDGYFSGPVRPGQFTLATLPAAASYNGFEIDVTNATGGPKRCRSNGSVWQILNTNTQVS